MPGGRWFPDETYVKVAGRWMSLYPAVDQHGQVIDILVSERRDGTAARAVSGALKTGPAPLEVTTDRAPVYLRDRRAGTRRAPYLRAARQ
jgi:transposase, IS6 family